MYECPNCKQSESLENFMLKVTQHDFYEIYVGRDSLCAGHWPIEGPGMHETEELMVTHARCGGSFPASKWGVEW